MISDVIIMAGGFGERLWPASSPEHPKQFMALEAGSSFLQESIRRAAAVIGSDGRIVVVTRKEIEAECIRQAQETGVANVDVISEPCPRHTSAAIMTGIYYIQSKSSQKNQTILVLTSDHVITPTQTFVEDCKNAARTAEDGHFVCFSIPPTEPATGYGYIKAGKDLYGDETTYKIDNFKEKPELEVAKVYIADGHYYWNSGMFVFTSETFLSEMQKCTPSVYNAFEAVRKNGLKLLEDVYKIVPEIAVDKAIAEKTEKAAAVKTHFEWTDVGSWDVFSEVCVNPANPSVAQIESRNNFIYSDIPVALCGVEDLIVVVKNGRLLVMKKGESQLVREVSKQLK